MTRSKKRSKLFYFLLLFLWRCQPVDLKTQCEELAFGSYRGHPKSAQVFKDKCQHLNLDYSPSLCQRALKSLVLHGNQQKLESDFGPKIMNCFTENDRKNFLIAPAPTNP